MSEIVNAVWSIAKDKDSKAAKIIHGKIASVVTSKIAEVLELVIAALVLITIIAGIASIFPEVRTILSSNHVAPDIIHFLEKASIIVVGIEFFKMLCHPTSENVLETIIFLVARHMIINERTPLEDLISVIAVILLVLAKRYLRVSKEKQKKLAEQEIRSCNSVSS